MLKKKKKQHKSTPCFLLNCNDWDLGGQSWNPALILSITWVCALIHWVFVFLISNNVLITPKLYSCWKTQNKKTQMKPLGPCQILLVNITCPPQRNSKQIWKWWPSPSDPEVCPLWILLKAYPTAQQCLLGFLAAISFSAFYLRV